MKFFNQKYFVILTIIILATAFVSFAAEVPEALLYAEIVLIILFNLFYGLYFLFDRNKNKGNTELRGKITKRDILKVARFVIFFVLFIFTLQYLSMMGLIDSEAISDDWTGMSAMFIYLIILVPLTLAIKKISFIKKLAKGDDVKLDIIVLVAAIIPIIIVPLIIKIFIY